MTPPPAAAAPAARAPGRIAHPPARTPIPARPRRISGPARRPQRGSSGLARPQPRSSQDPIALARVLGRLSHSRLLDRLVRGRLSIAIVAFALIGIVTLQLGLLKLNSSIGRTLQREATLQRQNSALSIENSEMLAGERVESSAAHLGMRLAPVSELRFLSARGQSPILPAMGALKTAVAATGSGSSAARAGSQRLAGGQRISRSRLRLRLRSGSTASSSAESSAQGTGQSASQGSGEPASQSRAEAPAQGGAEEASAAGAAASAGGERTSQPTGGEAGAASRPAEGASHPSSEASSAGGAQAGGG